MSRITLKYVIFLGVVFLMWSTWRIFQSRWVAGIITVVPNLVSESVYYLAEALSSEIILLNFLPRDAF